MPVGSPLLDQYEQDGIVTPGLQRALDSVRQRLGQQFQLQPRQVAPEAPSITLRPPVPALTRTAPAAVPGLVPFGQPSNDVQMGGRITDLSPTGANPAASPSLTPRPLSRSAQANQAELDRLSAPPLPTLIPRFNAEGGLVRMQKNPLAHTKADTGLAGEEQIRNPWIRRPLQVLDAIGSAFLPGLMVGLPGTQLHHLAKLRGAEALVASDQQRATAEANRQHTIAAANDAEARAYDLMHPKPKDLFELWHTQNPEGTAADWATFQNSHRPISNEFESWANDPANKGKPVSEFLKLKQQYAAPKEGESPLGERVDQLNKILAARYQVLNPGKPLPGEFTIPANATQKDYDRIDRALESTERAAGTKAQQDQIRAMQQEARATAQATRDEAKADREEKEGRRMVTGIEPGTGRTVAGSVADAKAGKWTGVMDLPAAEQSQVYNARHWMPLADKPGTEALAVSEPEKAGVLQLIDALDKRGVLGALATRWNDFWVRNGFGTGNPETDRMLQALRTKMGLSDTLLMKVHVGNRGGSYMLEHFEDLANQKKLNANLLRTGVKSELNYAEHLAAIPAAGNQPAASAAKTFTQADVDAAVKAHPGMTASQIEDAFRAKGWRKQ